MQCWQSSPSWNAAQRSGDTEGHIIEHAIPCQLQAVLTCTHSFPNGRSARTAQNGHWHSCENKRRGPGQTNSGQPARPVGRETAEPAASPPSPPSPPSVAVAATYRTRPRPRGAPGWSDRAARQGSHGVVLWIMGTFTGAKRFEGI